MTEFADIGAAVVGTGFIGTVHTQALRRLGVNVKGVLGSSPERGKARAAEMGVPHAYATLEDLLTDEGVDVVHVTSPNHAHYPQVKAILEAGKHVICEKPLAMTSAESAEMVEIARASGKIAAVCYNIRFYPLNQHAQAMIQAGELGQIRFVTGHYHQDWLAKPTDWNWRLESEVGGALRSVGDIGTHWVDLTGFVTGLKPEAVMADLATFLPERQKPTGPVETFSSGGGTTETVEVETDDASMIMIRYHGGARGVMSTSQINIGRKNSLHWDVAGATASAAWDSETPDHLFLGHRDAPNQTLMRDFTLMNPTGTAAASLPPGHVEGFADSFFAFFRAVYADVAAGARQRGSTWATFEDGHDEMRFCDAVLRSAREGRWVAFSEI
ncbi:Predicted dehydrogenase [Cribrihabitans marinus]|uniref:Predicted dehydrogenase n=1 Tax=Cribrihabitans marinus TaxID=1227549 RepID=A0A1H7D8W5_9RHOB|nr:Gfo/Idh/MocA family oxidoreductase [Cribrihabitans marinus]GGH38141.1 oxidoreductase [Cribrihabitans marinus]SEJ98188.1 Predicted dehydrogenase [Cribrihabitans marinus]